MAKFVLKIGQQSQEDVSGRGNLKKKKLTSCIILTGNLNL